MIAIGLNCILGFLLVCGLMMGMTLNKRLKALRESHAGFAKAVQELDSAAFRTEASLADLRASTEQARTELASRIDQARLLTQRLDTLTAEAARAIEEQPLALTQALPPTTVRVSARVERDTQPLRPAALSQREAANPRSKVMVDDDLFEVAGASARRAPMAMMGGRR
jgi:F0F1-type ATP synthase membrane subunit b/b'